METPGGPVVIEEFIGVYNANGTFVGELTYWVNARLGRGHCELCDITHGSVREKAEWRACRASLPIPFTTVHLDEQSPAVAALTEGLAPCVVARTADDVVMLLSAEDLKRVAGSPPQLIEVLLAAVALHGFTLDA